MLAVLVAGLVLAPVTAAEPPFRVPDYVTDRAGVLSEGQRVQVENAVNQLYNDNRTRLWVVYVDSFGQGAVGWARTTMQISDFGDRDALLAIATDERAYAFQVPTDIMSQPDAGALQRNTIEPALRQDDWTGAAVAAANGLDTPSTSTGPSSGAGFTWFGVLFALAIFALAILALWWWMRRRRRKRREAEFAAARRVDPSDPNALAAVPIDALDDLSKAIVVDVDNAVRTSDSELALAVEEFGAAQTDPFSRAVSNAKTTLAQAFNVRQILDDAVPESMDAAPRPADPRGGRRRQGRSGTGRSNGGVRQAARSGHQRPLAAGRADPADGRPHRPPRPVGAGAGVAAQPIRRCRTDFGGRQCGDRQTAVGASRIRTSPPRGHSSLARSASRWVWWMPSAPRNPRSGRPVRCSMRSTPPASTSIAPSRRCPRRSPTSRTASTRPTANCSRARAAHQSELSAARDQAAAAVADAEKNGNTDPLGAFTRLTKADADLDRLLASVAEERQATERLNRAFDQALFSAQSRVRGVSDFIDTRRGSIGPEARTRLAEAVRQLQAAQDKRATNLNEAIAHANGAAMLAGQAQSLASDDVQAAQRTYTSGWGGGGSGSDMGGVIGGIIIGNILSGAMRGGFGGGFGGGLGMGRSTSFGGSSRSSGRSYSGGGGRF